ncbi:MAG: type VI secretion protein IcmF/TssM N-terminal domain-containing protein [Phycisphaerales bacterium]
MVHLIDSFIRLPPTARYIMAALGVTSIAGILRGSGISWRVVAVLGIGLAAVAALVLVYLLILRAIRKKKADPFERQIREAGGMVPSTVSDAADRARLDEMRKKFEKGIATFREKGKDLYSLPWFVIIGEPGSGKTEAIRHCGIGFPPGLQDELQGTGGTLNMDWWFTNDAVILDTAGRLTFGDVESTDSREWSEFLKLLKKTRPNCPINGLIVTIPVDSLIKDDAATVERKGGRIARQLDLIQSNLGVRFPVFLVVTKADMLTGFRQFFADLRDPQLQHQIMGWSNPDSIDDTFDASKVEQYLGNVQDSITRRRYTKLLEPTNHGEKGVTTRADMVDELYAFPEAIGRITSRLRRYLELIFVGGEWASKPLFLRGIYFTSSMQHGEALDTELAEALGVAVESLHEAAWPDDRAYFLRDVFKEKVFRERGLVTNAANARQRQRSRRMLVIGAGAIATAIAAALITWAVIGYRGALDPQARFWSDARTRFLDQLTLQRRKGGGVDVDNHRWQIVRRTDSTGGGYDGPFKYNQPDDTQGTRFAAFLPESQVKSQVEINIPAAFRLVAMLKGEGATNLFLNERIDASRALFETAIIAPLTRATSLGTAGNSVDWNSDDAVAALANLIDIEIAAEAPAPRALSASARDVHDPSRSFQIAPMLRFALLNDPDAPTEELAAEAASLQDVADWLYTSGAGNVDWPSPDVAALVHPADVSSAINSYVASSNARLRGAGGELKSLRDLQAALERLAEAERELLTLTNYRERPNDLRLEDWKSRYAAYLAAHDALGPALGSFEGTSLASAWRARFAKIRSDVERDYDILLAAAVQQPEGAVNISTWHRPAEGSGETAGANADGPPTTTAVPIPKGAEARVASLEAGFKNVLAYAESDEVSRIEAALAALDTLYLESVGTNGERRYQLRAEMYQRADALLDSDTSADEWAFGTTAQALAGIRGKLDAARSEIITRARLAGWPGEAEATANASDPVIGHASAARTVAADLIADHLAGEMRQEEIARGFTSRLASYNDAQALEVAIAQQASGSGPAVRLPDVPFSILAETRKAGTTIAGEAGFHPSPAAGLFRDWQAAHAVLSTRADSARLEALRTLIFDYATRYASYWTDAGSSDVIGQLSVNPRLSWSEFQSLLEPAEQSRITAALLGYAEDVRDNALRDLTSLNPAALDARLIDDVKQRLSDAAAIARPTPEFTNEYELVLRSWKRLPDKALDAGQMVLRSIERGDRTDKFIYSRAAGRFGITDLIDRFWARFSHESLELLATEVAKDANAAFAEIEGKYRRFPLGPYTVGGNALTPEEVNQARATVQFALISDGGNARETGFAFEIEELINKLRSPLSADRMAVVNDMAAILRSLPEEGAHRMTVSVLPADAAATNPPPATPVWHFIAIGQGQSPPRTEKVNSILQPVTFGTFATPGPPLSLAFKKAAVADEPDASVQLKPHGASSSMRPVFESQWPLLELLAVAHSVEIDPADARAWRIELRVSGEIGGQTREHALWLRVTFDDAAIPPQVVKRWRSE